MDKKTNGATESYPWGEVFYPERKIVRSQYFANVKENVRENIKSFLTRKSKINDWQIFLIVLPYTRNKESDEGNE